MKTMFIVLVWLILLTLASVVPEVSAQTETSVRAAREEPTLVAHRGGRHCHLVKGHYHRDRAGRLVYVRSHRHCHGVRRHVA
jgi:hypothetical protein